MRKRHPLFLTSVTLLSALLLPSCGGEGDKEVASLNFGRLYDPSIDTEAANKKFANHSDSLTYGELENKLSHKESFLLLVYEKGNTCTCWYRYEETLLRFMKAKNVAIYGIDPGEFEGGKETHGIKYAANEENIVVIKDGEVFAQRSTTGVDDDFVEYDNFLSWIEKRVSYSDMLAISKAQLDDLFLTSANPSFLVYFGRASCGDCSYIDQHFLYRYNQEKRARSYYLDCDEVGIRFDSEEDKKNGLVSENWKAFKNDYGLSNVYNTDLGYGEGYVPSFIVYNKGDVSHDKPAAMVHDMAVTFNDVIEKKDDAYFIADSFYDPSRLSNSECFADSKDEDSLLNQELSADEVEVYSSGYIAYKQSKAISKHQPLLKKFLDFYLS